jgi:cystathionine beta-lyase family protein involved in aluminum resistance
MAWATRLVNDSRIAVTDEWERVAAVRRVNQRRVLNAFRQARISDIHLTGTTGYGYGDPARDGLEGIYSELFATESALVRPQVVSGTHAISATLFGLCRPGDEILSATGTPYDTLQRVLKGPNSLDDWGISYREASLLSDNQIDVPQVLAAIGPNTRMVIFQRSRGYLLRPSFTPTQIGAVVEQIKNAHPHVICFADNCYGEFVEETEPTHHGIDIMAGSLIKNPGGTLAPAGGYIVGKQALVRQVADHIIAPGLGYKVGPMLGLGRALLQGLYLAPLLVGEALCGAILAAHAFEQAGYDVYPRWNEHRTDTVQAITLKHPEALLLFCRAIQSCSPVDSMAVPEADELPGYADPVVMAAGTFVQGASSELSADAPMRAPYTVFMQGGSSRDQTEMALETALQYLAEKGYVLTANQLAK